MNTQLNKLFEKYNVSEKDRHELNQIFWLLPFDKKNNMLNNFELLAIRLKSINKEIDLERKILVWDLFEDIKVFYTKHWDKIWAL